MTTLLTEAADAISAEAVLHVSDHARRTRLIDLARQLREREAKGLDAARWHLVRALDAVPIEVATAMAAIERALAFVDAALATKPGDGESR